MCGINGFNFVDKKIIKKMNNSLKHRGPDAEGSYFDKNLSLGHRRLSILDLSKKGSQPMTYANKKKSAIIVFNGEIYNYQEIRKVLQKKGYKFKSNSDTEVILASYLEWGFDCVNKFNGMWAFCIYDKQKNILFLSRDRLGQKPLYYYFNEGKFIFSSEIKGILQHKIKKEFSKDAIDLYFSMGFIPSPYSIYKNIYKLEARQNLIFDLGNKKIKKSYYFDYLEYKPIYDKGALIQEGKDLIKSATKYRLIADVPTGAFLSGGIDSSTVVSEIVKNLGRKHLTTYSIGFEEKYDETPYIEIMQKVLSVKHNHKYFQKGDFEEILKKIFYFYDEPLCDPSMFPTFMLSKFARESLTVALSGDGGDEMFGGYPRHKMASQMELIRKMPVPLREILIKLLAFKKMGKLSEGLRLSLLPAEDFFSEARIDIYKPEIYKKISKNNFKECLKLSKGDLTEATILMDRYFNTMGDNYLAKVDRASMAFSLEVRSPFLDYRFLEYASKIPSKWKASKFNEKILLKEIIKGLIPDKIINRKKKGFTPPIEKWLLKKKYQKQLDYAVNDLFNKKIIDENWVKFYKERILGKKDQIAKTYQIRLFLFYGWWKYWKHN